MGMISKVGRRRLGVRLTMWTITGLLVIGSITMLYPFALMLAGSTKSNVDVSESQVVPGFLINDTVLWRKHVEGLFNESLRLMRSTHPSDAPSFERIATPREPNHKLADAWVSFLDEAKLPSSYFTVGYLQSPTTKRVLPLALRQFRSQLYDEYDGDIGELNRSLGTEFDDWNVVAFDTPQYLRRSQVPSDLPFYSRLRDFMERQPYGNRVYFSIEGYYREQFLRPQFPDIASFNTHHGTKYTSYDEVRLARRLPPNTDHTAAEQATWESFVRTTLNLLWIRVDASATPAYRQYLQAKYQTLEALNRNHKSQYDSFDQVPIIDAPPSGGLPLSDWDGFIQGWTDPATGLSHSAPLASLRVNSVDFLFQDFLKQRYQHVATMNAALGVQVTDFPQIAPPQEDLHLIHFRDHRSGIRREFVTRNYVTVADYLLLRGRAIWNTVVYCVLAIGTALLVNPLAAYALSRYKPPSTYRLLMLMMLTMAFPPMVTQIPTFLMLRDLGLLNTFWALVLPGLANGYSIFLLKGFFDSLPKELYESADLDGAGEIRVFWEITMSLSKPILAVVALSAFTAAYSNFMFALLICQDQRMWTLMVWLFQLQSTASQGVVLASLTLAAIPTLVVFVLCQRVIMRGIVVPVEK